MLGDDPHDWIHFPGMSGVFAGMAMLLLAAWFISGVMIWRYEITTLLSRDMLAWRKTLVIGIVVCILLGVFGIFSFSAAPDISTIDDHETAIKTIQDHFSEIEKTKASFNSAKPFWKKNSIIYSVWSSAFIFHFSAVTTAEIPYVQNFGKRDSEMNPRQPAFFFSNYLTENLSTIKITNVITF